MRTMRARGRQHKLQDGGGEGGGTTRASQEKRGRASNEGGHEGPDGPDTQGRDGNAKVPQCQSLFGLPRHKSMSSRRISFLVQANPPSKQQGMHPKNGHVCLTASSSITRHCPWPSGYQSSGMPELNNRACQPPCMWRLLPAVYSVRTVGDHPVEPAWSFGSSKWYICAMHCAYMVCISSSRSILGGCRRHDSCQFAVQETVQGGGPCRSPRVGSLAHA